ncbi:hypothetical protein EON63_18430 [archaeon]|nr:MAG: hypothetical protein EON63_18430 [archaeon]
MPIVCSHTPGHSHGFLLVLNEQSVRLDNSIYTSVSRLVDSFGEGMLKQLGVVFTKAFSRSAEDSKRYVENKVRPMIQSMRLNMTGKRWVEYGV